ncbi:hypothetical protein R1sor_026640 [Riccia sorocarpa]|uniref:Uncharacterized protein n=1 Tax=Riccia sorocarpa TaxID=122646 RepID=A0ABD3GDN3_9MARC
MRNLCLYFESVLSEHSSDICKDGRPPPPPPSGMVEHVLGSQQAHLAKEESQHLRKSNKQGKKRNSH